MMRRTDIQTAGTCGHACGSRAMMQSRAMRVAVHALFSVLIYSPVLGTYTGTVAAAQSVQNTTTSYLYDARVRGLTKVHELMRR